ncbi:MAG: hypothetical protein P8Y70_12655 [Candidatus Lokiarchaeota archaeon]
MILEFNDARRIFQYDYIFFDACFLTVWIIFIIKYKMWNVIKVGAITGFIVYCIDAIWWYNTPAGPNYPPGTFIREYWIGGVHMPHPIDGYFWIKFGADFMMNISYSMFAFGWLLIAYKSYRSGNKKRLALFTSLFFGSWMLTPILSNLIPLNDTIVRTVRHMDTQMSVWIANVIIGYSIVFLIYGTNLFKRKNYKIIEFIFLTGVTESFFMEFPLWITGIRPSSFYFLLFELVILFNQGAPYLYILWDIVWPWTNKKLKIILKAETKPKELVKEQEIATI